MPTVVAAQMYTLRDFTKTPQDIANTLKKAVAAVNHQSRATIMDKPRLRSGVDLAGDQQPHIARQPRYAMAVAAAQIGPDQAFGHDGGIMRAGAMLDENVGNEASEFVMANQLGGCAHALPRTGK